MLNDEQKCCLFIGVDSDSLTRDCRRMREILRVDPPSADEVIDFLDGYNSFINHATRPPSLLREAKMLL